MSLDPLIQHRGDPFDNNGISLHLRPVKKIGELHLHDQNPANFRTI